MQNRHIFYPGQEWLYLKLYCGYYSADHIIEKKIFPVMEKHIKNGNISKWFFIRYSDPDHHIRLRACLSNPSDQIKVLQQINLALDTEISHRIIWKTELSTYIREVGRYPEIHYPLAEKWFFEESRMVSSIIRKVHRSEDETLRWLSALKISDSLFNLFHLNAEQKRTFTSANAKAFHKELNITKSIRQQLAAQYRQNQKLIQQSLEIILDPEIDSAIEDFITSISPYAEKVIPEVMHLQDHIHMCCNRLFTSKQRLQEFVIYDYLTCYYTSKAYRSHEIAIHE
jgi:thiopeptide-type bacteriocin biosynthesis protein